MLFPNMAQKLLKMNEKSMKFNSLMQCHVYRGITCLVVLSILYCYWRAIEIIWSLQVSEEGDILYVFPKNYRSKLGAKSFRIKAEPLIEKAKVLKIVVIYSVLLLGCTCCVVWPWLCQGAGEYLIRVSFGTALIASIVIVYTAIIALVTSSRRYYISEISQS